MKALIIVALLSFVHLSGASSVDVDEECYFWASTGECQKNPDYMLSHCEKSCGELHYPKIYGETTEVVCTTTKGDLSIEVHKSWSPFGAARFLELVRIGFYQDIGIFRCVDGFLAQFGISDKPQYKRWHHDLIPDDDNVGRGILKNYLSFAGHGPNSRGTQIFIAFEDLDFLGSDPWETPFGRVVGGQDVLDALYRGYGEISAFGNGPDQLKIHQQGNSYLKEEFPLLDYIQSCRIADDFGSDDEAVDKLEEVPKTEVTTATPALLIDEVVAGQIIREEYDEL